MSVIPVIGSAADLESAIKFANRNRSARYFVAKKAEALGCPEVVPPSWGIRGLVAAFSGEWSDKARDKAAEKGVAMKDGSYPIKDKQDLKRAIQAFGRAKKGDKEAVRRHIIERARALGARSSLPESWHVPLTADGAQVGTSDEYLQVPEEIEEQDPTHAGLAIQAADTGRVLMLQRALDEEDPASGKWEFPGGGIDEDDESPFDGACREFCEETGLGVPDGEHVGSWVSSDGVYQGFLMVVPSEADAFEALNPNVEAAHNIENPDDPGRENPEVTAWMHPDEIQGNPAVRPEVHESTDWSLFDPEARDSVDSEETPDDDQDEEYIVKDAYRPLAASANGLHTLGMPFPDQVRGVMQVLASPVLEEGLTPVLASGLVDWQEHPDSVPAESAVRYEAVTSLAESSGLTAGAVLSIKKQQSDLGWMLAEQVAELASGGYLENHSSADLKQISRFLRPHAPLMASAIDRFLDPDAITAASWSPKLHPRDRDGQFIEIGDIVNIFDTGQTIPTFQGKVVGNHRDADGRDYVAVEYKNASGDTHTSEFSTDKIAPAPEHKADLDGPSRPDSTDDQDTPAPRGNLQEGDRVTTEFGPGVVNESTGRSTTVALDNGERINVQKGTPGHDRIVKDETPAPAESASEAESNFPPNPMMEDFLISKGYGRDVVDSLTDEELRSDFENEGGLEANTDEFNPFSEAPAPVDADPDSASAKAALRERVKNTGAAVGGDAPESGASGKA